MPSVFSFLSSTRSHTVVFQLTDWQSNNYAIIAYIFCSLADALNTTERSTYNI